MWRFCDKWDGWGRVGARGGRAEDTTVVVVNLGENPAPARPAPAARPALLWAGLILVGLEILALLAAAVWMFVDRPDGAMSGWGYAATFAGVLVMFALLLYAGGRALWRGMRWGRGPVVAWQLLQFFTAVTMSDVIGKPAAWAVGVLSLIAVVCFLAPASLAATSGTVRPSDEANAA